MSARLGLSGVLAVGWEALAVLGEEVAGKVLAGEGQAHELMQRQQTTALVVIGPLQLGLLHASVERVVEVLL